MKTLLHRTPCLVYMLVASFASSPLHATPRLELTCKVSGSNDAFNVYPEDLSYASKSFLHYQLIKGLTVLVVNRDTMRFNRLTNLNLLQHSTLDPKKRAEAIQLFDGVCKALQIGDHKNEARK